MQRTDLPERVVFLTDDLPYPPHGGGKLRDFCILELLRDIVPVQILAFHGDPETPAPENVAIRVIPREPPGLKRVFFPLRPYIVNGFSSRMAEALEKNSRPNQILWCSRLLMGKYLNLAKTLGYRTVLDEHNVESSLLFQSALSNVKTWPHLFLALQSRHYEKVFCETADQVIAVSRSDAGQLRRLAPGATVEVLPNCLDTESYRRPQGTTNQSGILFTGTLSYEPNREGLTWFVEQVLPILKNRISPALFPRIRVAGANQSPVFIQFLRQNGLEVIVNPVSMVPLLEEAEIIIVPLLSGSGTRLKIMEAFSVGKSVVSTELGAEGLELNSGDGLLIASDPNGFAEEILKLIHNPSLRKELEKKALQIAKTRFDWRLHREFLKNFLSQVMK